MAFNHDQFVGSARYKALDADLQWYIDAVAPKIRSLKRLVRGNPDKAQELFRRDLVMQKIAAIHRRLGGVLR